MNSNAMGDKIAAARKRANMTQEELAHKLSVSRQNGSPVLRIRRPKNSCGCAKCSE